MNNFLLGKHSNPIKRNMEESQFSLMKSVYARVLKQNAYTIQSGERYSNMYGPSINIKYQDTSSYIERKKAKAIGKESNNSTVSYSAYDPVGTSHTKRRVISAGTVSPKKKSLNY
uniref:Uncharacterized protein n=1 Tax=viral metagenome TaxID=1070528 RepID=A0A6C0JK16_9ZZZZ